MDHETADMIHRAIGDVSVSVDEVRAELRSLRQALLTLAVALWAADGAVTIDYAAGRIAAIGPIVAAATALVEHGARQGGAS